MQVKQAVYLSSVRNGCKYAQDTGQMLSLKKK